VPVTSCARPWRLLDRLISITPFREISVIECAHLLLPMTRRRDGLWALTIHDLGL